MKIENKNWRWILKRDKRKINLDFKMYFQKKKVKNENNYDDYLKFYFLFGKK